MSLLMKKACVLGLVLAIPLMVGCAGVDSSDSQTNDSTATVYVPINEFNDAALEGAFYDLQDKLNGQFGNLCGDTFCGGDYPNLVGLRMGCSVTSKRGDVHDCVWAFTGSQSSVDPQTAVINEDVPSFQCHFKAKTTGAKLITLLANSADPIHEVLPGGTVSIYDGLSDCFQHPIGKTPITYSDDPNAKYVDVLGYYHSAASQTKWQNARAALKDGFDRICGDTFCGSDFSDLQALEFNCAITKSSGNVKSCEWAFGGSYSEVNATTGAVIDTTQTWKCPVAVKGSISQLLTVLTATGPDQAIDRPLPGLTTSTYDAIGNCLP